MDFFETPTEFIVLSSVALVLLLSAQRTLLQHCEYGDNTNEIDDMTATWDLEGTSSLHTDGITHAALQQLQIWSALSAVEEDIGYWVKPRSTTWFSRFLLHEYDDERWVQMFHMTKRSMLYLANLLQPAIQKKNTKYRFAVPVIVRLACSIFKLSHGASFLVCSEMFAVGRSTVCVMLREVVEAINIALRSEISWPSGESLIKTVKDFQQLCSLPGVAGAIDGTQIAIRKPKFASVDYYYFKSGGYSMNCQAVVDSSKRFLDLYVGMPGSTNDARMLRRSTIFQRAQRNCLWDVGSTFDGFSPYLLGDAGYPLAPWLMVPHRQHQHLNMVDRLYNKKLSKGRCVVENAFALLKQSFKELQVKSELNVVFLPDVIICCGLLHNLLLKQSHEDVERLLTVLRNEEMSCQAMPAPRVVQEPSFHVDGGKASSIASQKRRDIALFVAVQRIIPT